MDVIIMPSITFLATRLSKDFPGITFTSGQEFHWSPQSQTIFFNEDVHAPALLLHELAHALLEHRDYQRDIQLIELEREAWRYAKSNLGNRYKIDISDTVIQDSLDTYRDWLYVRSICPECSATGVQTGRSVYTCLACNSRWRVNDARVCALRRYKLTKNTPS